MTEKLHQADPKDLADVAIRGFSWLGRDPHEQENDEPRVVIRSADGVLVLSKHRVSDEESWESHQPHRPRERIVHKYGGSADVQHGRRQWSEEWLSASLVSYVREMAAVFPSIELPPAFLPSLPEFPTPPLPSPGSAEERAPRIADDARWRFESLAEEWQEGTFGSSMVRDMVLHAAYQQVIGMGRDALPLIFERMRDGDRSYWYWALAAIVGADMAEGAADEDEARERWLEWGQREGHLPPAG